MFEQKIFDAYSTAQLSTSVLAKSCVHPLHDAISWYEANNATFVEKNTNR
jgi:hypothetical protein